MSVANPVATGDEILISGDSHVSEPVDLWEKRLPEKFREAGPKFPNVTYGEGNHARVGGRDPVERLKDMAIDGMSAEVLYPTLGNSIYRLKDVELIEACACAYNDWMAEYCSAAPDRLWGQAMIPLFNIDYAIKELDRSKKAGMVGATIWLAPPDELPFHRPHYEKFWTAAEELGVPVSMHINAGYGHYATRTSLTPLTRQHQSVNLNKFAAMTSTTDIICSGVLERHPRLKIVLAEIQVGWIPFWLNESDDWNQTQPNEELEGMPPSAYFWRQMYSTFIDDRAGMYLAQEWGQDNFLFSSDYPHVNSIWPTSRDIIKKSMDDLPAEARQKIVGLNTARVYDKPVPAPIAPPADGVSREQWSRRSKFER